MGKTYLELFVEIAHRNTHGSCIANNVVEVSDELLALWRIQN